MSVPEEIIKKVSEETGYSEELVRTVAEKMGPVIYKASSSRLVCIWAGLRCLTCIGPVRKIFWCIIASLCAIAGR